MSRNIYNRVLAVSTLAVGLGWSVVTAADNPPEKGCCGECLTEIAPAPKPAAEMQKGPPAGKGPGGKDEAFVADRDTFHFMLDNHKAIKRTVKKLENGVETVTESDKPEVAKKIQEHVPAMYERLKSGKGVRYWDPLFAEAFKHGKKMKMTIENTKTGVKVVETSDEAGVVKIIQAQADVVSKFVEKGFDEAHKEHPVPAPEKKK